MAVTIAITHCAYHGRMTRLLVNVTDPVSDPVSVLFARALLVLLGERKRHAGISVLGISRSHLVICYFYWLPIILSLLVNFTYSCRHSFSSCLFTRHSVTGSGHRVKRPGRVGSRVKGSDPVPFHLCKG